MNFQDAANFEEKVRRHCKEMISVIEEVQVVLTNSGKRINEKLTKETNMPEVLSEGEIESFAMECLGSSRKGLPYLFRTIEEAHEKANEVFNNPSLFRRDVIRVKGYFSLLLMTAKTFYLSFPERKQQFLSDLLDMDRKTQMLCMWAIESSAYVPRKVNEFRRHNRKKKTDKHKIETTQRHNILEILEELNKKNPGAMFTTHGIAKEICKDNAMEITSRTVSNWFKNQLEGFLKPNKKYSICEWLQAYEKVGKV